MSKVFILQEQLPAFRLPFYERVGRAVDLTILHSTPTRLKNRKPVKVPEGSSYSVRQVPNIQLGGGRVTLHPEMLAAIRREKPDVVVLEARLGFLTTALTALLPRGDLRIAWWLSGYEGSSERVNNMKRVLRRTLLTRGDGFICYGTSARRHLEMLGIRENVHIAFNSLDSDEIRRHRAALLDDPNWPARRSELRRGADFQLLYTGRVEHSKRVPDLIEGLARLRRNLPELRFRFVCVGGGEDLSSIVELAAARGLADVVEFTGPVYEEEKLAEHFLASDVFVLPGTGGLAINQAISYGLPVVVTRADGTEEDTVLDGVNGLYFERSNPADLADQVARLVADPTLRDTLAAGSLRVAAETSNIDRMVGGFLAAIDSVLRA